MEEKDKTQMDLLNEFLFKLADSKLGYRRKLILMRNYVNTIINK